MNKYLSLYDSVGNSASLEASYIEFIQTLIDNDFWNSGSCIGKRVNWKDGESLRTEERLTFSSPGLYIWGYEDRPVYIGITTSSFKKRFRRYIWERKSQCKLAEKYCSTIKTKGLDGFPEEIIKWYSKGYGNSRVRLNGSVRFAQEGISKIWFTLLPYSDVNQIKKLEKELIPIAQSYNLKSGFDQLLNVEFNK